ncbi:MAG TPA: EamA/RhaT family transporter, partial [Afipia sp.]|nr:EamA/RhaT family transporter [Afipia sp.]HCX15500.1 EamA/RhaT family transporter [Afipia sp.]
CWLLLLGAFACLVLLGSIPEHVAAWDLLGIVPVALGIYLVTRSVVPSATA